MLINAALKKGMWFLMTNYIKFCLKMIQKHEKEYPYLPTDILVDIIDVELFTGEKEVKEILDYAHKHNVYVIMSNHDFKKTLTYEQIIDRLCNMQEYDADICKIALMPQNKEDVLTLLKATKDMTEKYADRPIVSM